MRIYLSLLCLIICIGCTLTPEGTAKTTPSTANSSPTTESAPENTSNTTPSTPNSDTAVVQAKNLIAWHNTANKSYRLGKVEKTDVPIWESHNANEQSKMFNKQLNKQLDNKRKEIDKVIGLANTYLNDLRIADLTVYKFYNKDDDGGAFANTFAAMRDFTYQNVMSKFAELFFQAEKIFKYSFKDMTSKKDFDNYQDAFAKAKELHETIQSWGEFPKEVNKYVTTNAHPNANDWPQDWAKENIAVMSRVHAARFKGEPELFLSLISTIGKSIIVEDSPHDPLWGRGNKKGSNILGLLYMIHRERFWADFKKEKNTNFDHTNVDHVVYMLNWLNNYDGGTR